MDEDGIVHIDVRNHVHSKAKKIKKKYAKYKHKSIGELFEDGLESLERDLEKELNF
jgi:hypothetical protein